MGDERPVDEFPRDGKLAAWQLRSQLLARGYSAFEPDPIAALQARREAQPAS
jgi:hypothetical protein